MVKIDCQIIAIAITERATTVYTDDKGVIHLAKVAGMTVMSILELPLPPEDPQGKLNL